IAEKSTKKSSGILRARFQRLQARALIETTRSPDAVKLLDEAIRTFRSLGAKEFVGRTLYDLARAHARLDAQGEALKCALDAEQALERGDVIDRTLELQIHQFLAGLYFRLGDPASMEARAERARAIAEDVADPAAVAELYASLALTRYEQGDKEAALAYARKSVDLYGVVGDQIKAAETWNTIGWLFVQRQQYAKANEALDKAARMGVELGLPRLEAWVTLNRGGLALARGDASEALRLADEAANAQAAPSTVRARALLLRARALAASDAPTPQMKKAFDEAIAAHRGMSPREQARAHQYYADALSERKQAAEAFAEARKALELVGPKI
ncbi:MAG: tetratricopeptide repeat protein, partial [Chloroflexota bacterium]|nr:tetratricopeptide repeat protein [Chloroflexota bacterium]